MAEDYVCPGCGFGVGETPHACPGRPSEQREDEVIVTTYVLMDVGCRCCRAPSRLVLVSDDLDAVKAAWAEVTDGAEFKVREDDARHEDWPGNVLALDCGGSYAWVVYEWRPNQ